MTICYGTLGRSGLGRTKHRIDNDNFYITILASNSPRMLTSLYNWSTAEYTQSAEAVRGMVFRKVLQQANCLAKKVPNTWSVSS